MSSWLLAQVVVEQLVAAGVSDVVLCPGSRNAPLSIACAHAEPGLALHVRVDERSAAFLALGVAKASRRPVAIVTTSGTAVGNLLPAIMEAHHGGVPLVVLSADRPGFMINSGANQTTDQAGIFGTFTREAIRLSSDSGDAARWRSALRMAFAAASGCRTLDPGPVQVNLEFTEPLTPDGSRPPAPTPFVIAERQAVAPIGLAGRERSLVLVGDADAETGRVARGLAERIGVPLFAEPSSNARQGTNAIATYRVLLGRASLTQGIERVIVFGRPTLSRPERALLSRDDLELVMVGARPDWTDPGFAAQVVCDAVGDAPAGPPEWLASWQRADAEVSEAIDRLRRDAEHRTPGVIGLTASAAVLESLGPDDVLVVGSSNPIRDLDLAPLNPHPPLVFANRGLSGIDGTIATAMGVSIGSGRPTTCCLGDLTFLHDVGGLLTSPFEAEPRLRLVCGNDRGGGIFHTLEQGAPEFADSFERVFGTPHEVDLCALASAYGVRASRVQTPAELREALRRPIGGVELIEMQVDRTTRRPLDAAIRALANPN